VLALQVGLLGLGFAGLALSGLAVDVIRSAVDTTAPDPPWPFGWTPPAGVTGMRLVGIAAGLVLLMAIVRTALTWRYGVAIGRLVQADVVPRLRAAVYACLQNLSFRFFDATASGSIINRVTSDVQAVRSFIDQVLLQSVVLVLALGVSLGFMLSRHVGLTLACLATTPLLWVATTAFSRWVAPSYRKSRELSDRLITTLAETVQGMSVVKGFARESDRRALFNQQNAEVLQQQNAIFRRIGVFTPSVDLLGQSSLIVLLGYGGVLARAGRVSLGDLVVFAGILQQYGTQIGNLANIVNTLQQSLISARRVFEVLDTPAEIESPPAPTPMDTIAGALRFENVSFGYSPNETELDGVELDIAAGSRVVLFGETGAGKSTLLSLVPRFYDPRAGRVLVDGVDVKALDLRALRSRIGVVFQESFLFGTTVADNIAFGRPEATRAEIVDAARTAGAHTFIESLPEGYDTWIEEAGANLSGGQRQRIALARAILLDPAILLLDDPTAAVDTTTEVAILKALDLVTKKRTTLLATHRLAACHGADLIVVMEDGRIVERGTHEQLMRQGGHYRAAVDLHGAYADQFVEARS
jgi:ATP-binding cassette subfamily B protein